MSIWTWFTGVVQQTWFQNILNSIVRALKLTLSNVGQDALNKITAKIKEAAAHPTMSNTDKFLTVYAYAKSLVPFMGESALRFLIESLIQDLKSNDSI